MSEAENENSNPSAREFGPPTKDPWKGFRGICAGTLILEAIVVLLALPVVAALGGGVTWISGSFIVVIAVAMILGAGLQGKPWAMTYNLLLQLALFLGAFVDLSVAAVGLIFIGVWGYLLYLRRDMRIRLARGLLPGQRD